MKKFLAIVLSVIILTGISVMAEDTIHNPIGGGRYEITFIDAVDTEVEGFNITDGESDSSLVIGIIGGVIIAVSALAIITVLKRKNQ